MFTIDENVPGMRWSLGASNIREVTDDRVPLQLPHVEISVAVYSNPMRRVRGKRLAATS